jgi:hypothetical protein
MTRSQWKRASVCAFALVVGLASAATAVDEPGRKMGRQISVFEQILDRVLIESPNFLINSRDNSRGMYVECFGAVFSFRASLVEKFDWDEGDWPWGGRIEIDDEDRIIIRPDRGDEDDWEDEEGEDGDRRSWSSRREAQEERLYERGKREMIETILDYGDTMTSLSDDQWVSIVGLLEDSEYFLDNRISRLVIKARMSDLRAYADGDIEEEEMESRMEIMEF